MPNRTVAENVFIGREPVRGPLHLVDGKAMNRKCRELLQSLEIDIDPQTKAKDLSIAQQQMVEIAKAISSSNKLLIMDEPSEGLAPVIVDQLVEFCLKLQQTDMSLLLIEQNLSMAKRVSKYVNVMMTGKLVYQDSFEKLLSDKDLTNNLIGI